MAPRVNRGLGKRFLLFISVVVLNPPNWAQTFQFLPEVDAYYRFTQPIRLTFQAKETREAGDPMQAEIGPSIDFFLKPLVRLKKITVFDPDDGKRRPLVLSAGFRYVPSVDKPTVWRMELVATPHLPLVAKILLSDGNRADLDWSKGGFSWRYRNKVSLERAVAIGSYHPSPYFAAEAFYLSQYQKWSTTALYGGCSFPFAKRFQLDPYYEHQNITSKRPNQQLNQFGLILRVYMGAKR